MWYQGLGGVPMCILASILNCCKFIFVINEQYISLWGNMYWPEYNTWRLGLSLHAAVCVADDDRINTEKEKYIFY